MESMSQQAGIAVGYISQIEHGSKTNPTRGVLESLARALNVTVGFLEFAGPLGLAGCGRVGRAFGAWVSARGTAFGLLSLEDRFRQAAGFLLERYPARWTRPALAFELGLSVRELNDILDRDWALRLFTLVAFCRVTGISLDLMLTGKVGDVLPAFTAKQFLRWYTRAARRREGARLRQHEA